MSIQESSGRLNLLGAIAACLPPLRENASFKGRRVQEAIDATEFRREQDLMNQDCEKYKAIIQKIKVKEPHIFESSIVTMSRTIDKVRATCPVINEDIYVTHPNLPRSIQFNADGKVLVHFSKVNQHDSTLCEPGAKKVPVFTMDYDTGKWFCSYTELCERIAEITEFNFKRTQNLPHFNRLISCIKYKKIINGKVCTATRFTLELGESGDLLELCSKYSLPLDDKLRIAGQIIEGIMALHAANLLHRDIKMENIFIDAEGNAIIGDLDSVCSCDSNRKGDFYPTYAYCSPEFAEAVLKNQDVSEFVNTKLDMFALGCLLYHLFIGPLPWVSPPYQNETTEEWQVRLFKGIIEKTKTLNSWFPEPKYIMLHHVIWRLLAYNPDERPSATDVKDVFDAIKRGLS